MVPTTTADPVWIPAGAGVVQGLLRLPRGARLVVLVAHGIGSGRLSSRNNFVAERLGQAGIATLLLDLLTEKEEEVDAVTAELNWRSYRTRRTCSSSPTRLSR